MKEQKSLVRLIKGIKYFLSNLKDNLISNIVLYFGKDDINDKFKLIFR